MREAIGTLPKGQQLSSDNGRFRYAVACEDCGVVLGHIDFGHEQPAFDPAASGLICVSCSGARMEG